MTTDPRDDRLAAIEARLDALERRRVEYCGVWSPDRTYARGEAVTWDGSLWIAKRDAATCRPGLDPEAWQLAVKRGRDARRDPRP